MMGVLEIDRHSCYTRISINDKPNIELPRSQNWSNSICINPTRSQKVLFVYSLCLITETMNER